MNADERGLEATFRVLRACPRPKIVKPEKPWLNTTKITVSEQVC
jgi:hypothetical protein